MDRAFKLIKFNWCIYALAPKLILDIVLLLYMSPGIILLGSIHSYITFDQLGILDFLTALYIYTGFFAYAWLIHDNKFKLLLIAAALLLFVKVILVIIFSYRYFYFLLAIDTIIPFLLFIGFWFIKEQDADEELTLARWFRNSFFIWLLMLIGHRLMIVAHTAGEFIYSAGCFLQIIAYIFIFYWSLLLFRKLRRKYKI